MGDVRCRTVWISDVHLGTRECAADALLAFLDRHDCDYLYLVGDIVDFWQLGRTPYWPQIQTDVVRKVLADLRASDAAITEQAIRAKMNELAVQALAEDGAYRSQFVTGTSNGGLTAHPGGDRGRRPGTRGPGQGPRRAIRRRTSEARSAE